MSEIDERDMANHRGQTWPAKLLKRILKYLVGVWCFCDCIPLGPETGWRNPCCRMKGTGFGLLKPMELAALAPVVPEVVDSAALTPDVAGGEDSGLWCAVALEVVSAWRSGQCGSGAGCAGGIQLEAWKERLCAGGLGRSASRR